MHTDPHGGNLLKAEGSVTKTHGVLCVAFDDADCYGRLESHPCLEVVVSCFRHLLNPVRLKHVGDNLAISFQLGQCYKAAIGNRQSNNLVRVTKEWFNHCRMKLGWSKRALFTT